MTTMTLPAMQFHQVLVDTPAGLVIDPTPAKVPGSFAGERLCRSCAVDQLIGLGAVLRTAALPHRTHPEPVAVLPARNGLSLAGVLPSSETPGDGACAGCGASA